MRIRRRLVMLVAIADTVTIGISLANAQFDHVSNWAAFDPGEHGVGNDPDGYSGAVFDGRYIYLAPNNNGSQYHGEVLRYDTQGDFVGASSWAAYDPGANGVGLHARGFWGAVFDGQHIYFIPGQDSTGVHGEVLQYDTTLAFASASSWAAYDPGANGVGIDPDGYAEGVFDGQYVYFVPAYNGVSDHSEVLRYDTVGSFSNISSWVSYNPRTRGAGGTTNGFSGGTFDGRYIYLTPHSDSVPAREDVLCYDTSAIFDDISSWAAFDPSGAGVGSAIDGRSCAVFDGRYVYLAPSNWHQEQHGQVLRYDTDPPELIPEVSEWGMAVIAMLLLSIGTVVLVRTRRGRIPG